MSNTKRQAERLGADKVPINPINSNNKIDAFTEFIQEWMEMNEKVMKGEG